MKSRLSTQKMIILAVLAISCGAITEAQAGVITAREVVPGCGTLDPTSSLTLLDKDFDRVCSMDILITVMNDGNLNRIVIEERVFNDEGPTWVDFHMQLGFGFGTLFTPVSPNCSVGFATTPIPSSSDFTPRGVSSNSIDWAGGTVERLETVTFTFTMNVEDLNAQCVPAGSRLPNGYTFTLRETPSVPEPATMLLLGTGLAGVAMKARKKLKSRNSK